MALTPSNVKRTNHAAGSDFLTFDTGGGSKVQAVAVVDEDGNHAGIEAEPFKTRAPVPTTIYNSENLENSVLAKTGAGVLREVTVVLNTGASARWLHLFDTVGAASGTPVRRLPIPTGPSSVTYTPVNGFAFTTGLRIATSSTLEEFTSPGDTEAVFHVDMD